MIGCLTPCGRPSVHANPLRGQFPYSFRGKDNRRTIFGIEQNLGKCVGIIGINVLGPKFSSNEESGHNVRMKIFDAAGIYSLDPEHIDQIKASPNSLLREYVRNLFIAQAKTLCTDLVAIVRQYFQNSVFGASYRCPMLYLHLGMSRDKSLVDK